METNRSVRLFMHDIIDNLYLNGKYRTSETYTTTWNSFDSFLAGRDISFKEITPSLIESYESWLLARGVCRNTCSFYMRILRATYNRAVDSGLTRQRNPFRHVYTGVDKTEKRAVSLATLRKLRAMDLSAEPNLGFARDMFMFSFYTRGMSFVDMAFLQKKDLQNGVLRYTRRKTGQTLHIRWESCMQEVLDRYPENKGPYLLPIITRTSSGPRNQYRNALCSVNSGLHVIADRLGLKTRLTTYVARHSWASIAYSKSIPLSVITEGMGHDSERTTRIYLASLNNTKVDRANSSILSLL